MGAYTEIAAALDAGPAVAVILSFGATFAAASFGKWAAHKVGGFFDDRAHAAWSERMQEIGRQSAAGNTAEVARLVDKERGRGS